MTEPAASILIPTLGNPLLDAALRSLPRGCGSVPYEVVLALNGVSADRIERPRGVSSAPLRVLEFAGNLGFGEACNRAAAAARGRYLVFLNDDTEVEPGWLAALVETAERWPSAGAVGSTILWPDRRLQEAGSIVWRDGSTWAIGRGEPFDRFDRGGTRPADYCSACSLLVRRELWRAIGGFERRYHPAYYEDADLCFEIRRRGRLVLHEPRSVLLHHESASSTAEAKITLMLRNRETFVSRWRDVLERHEPPPADPRGAVNAAVRRAAETAREISGTVPARLRRVASAIRRTLGRRV